MHAMHVRVLVSESELHALAVQVQKELHLPPGDFPSVEEYRELLSAYNFDRFEKLRPKMVQGVDDMLAYDIPDLLKKFRNPYD
jgi:EH domain-containing protein 1